VASGEAGPSNFKFESLLASIERSSKLPKKRFDINHTLFLSITFQFYRAALPVFFFAAAVGFAARFFVGVRFFMDAHRTAAVRAWSTGTVAFLDTRPSRHLEWSAGDP